MTRTGSTGTRKNKMTICETCGKRFREHELNRDVDDYSSPCCDADYVYIDSIIDEYKVANYIPL